VDRPSAYNNHSSATLLLEQDKPDSKQIAVHRPNSFAPLGGCPPVFKNRVIASLRVAGLMEMNTVPVVDDKELGDALKRGGY
jgi:hypothetical protein